MKTTELFENKDSNSSKQPLQEETNVRPWQFQGDSARLTFSVEGVRFELSINNEQEGNDYAEGYLGLSGSAGMVPDASKFAQQLSGILIEQLKEYFRKAEDNVKEVDIAIPGSLKFFDEDTQVNFIEEFVGYARTEPLIQIESGRNYVSVRTNI